MINIDGVLEAHAEDGSEGAGLAVRKDDEDGPGDLYLLKPGDYLTIYADNDKRTVLFDGRIEADPERRVPCGDGWNQFDWEVLFLHDPPLQAVLERYTED